MEVTNIKSELHICPRKRSMDDDIEEEEDHSKRIRLSTEKYDEQ